MKLNSKLEYQSSAVAKGFTAAFMVLPAVAGSLVTFTYAIVSIIGLIDLFRGRYSPRLDASDKIIVYPAVAFFVVNTLSLVRLDFEINDLKALVPSIIFLLPYFFIKRYRYVTSENQFSIAMKVVPYGAFLLLPLMAYQIIGPGYGRLVGAAGNAIPFAMICAIMAPICLMNFNRNDRIHKLSALVSFIIFLVALNYSQTRSMYVAIIPNVIIALGYLYYTARDRRRVLLFSAGLLSCVLVLAANSSKISSRILELSSSASAFVSGAQIQHESVGHRISLLKKGICFVQDRPVWGYGISKREQVIAAQESPNSSTFEFCSDQHEVFQYTHFHNGFLTAFIDAGIFGFLATVSLLFAPLVLAFLSPRDGLKSLRIAVALCLTSVYVMAGLTNLLFGHDLIDVVFLILASFLALSVKVQSETEQLKPN